MAVGTNVNLEVEKISADEMLRCLNKLFFYKLNQLQQ